MKYANYALAFCLGIIFHLVINNNLNSTTSLLIPENIQTNDIGLDNKINTIEQRTDELLVENQEIKNKLNHLINLLGTLDKAENSDFHEDSVVDDQILSYNEISVVKDEIYSSANSGTTTLNEVMNSTMIKSLPLIERQQVISEIVSKINSGELSKESLFPDAESN